MSLTGATITFAVLAMLATMLVVGLMLAEQGAAVKVKRGAQWPQSQPDRRVTNGGPGRGETR